MEAPSSIAASSESEAVRGELKVEEEEERVRTAPKTFLRSAAMDRDPRIGLGFRGFREVWRTLGAIGTDGDKSAGAPASSLRFHVN